MDTFLKKAEGHIVSVDFNSSYPSMGLTPKKTEENPLLFYYGVPFGVISSYLQKYKVRYEIGIMEENNKIIEKVISSEYGDYYFRRGGKHRSWLCYKVSY